MKRFALAAICLWANPLYADELLLKDGKKIEWISMKDAGDVIEIETKQGTKISVAKKDIDRVVFATPQAPLTGATFTFDKKRKLESVDLLTKIDPKKALNGEARLGGGTLTISGTLPMNHTKFPTSFTPPEEYDLIIVAERKAGLDDFIVGLVGGGKQFNFHIDFDKSSLMAANGSDTKKATVFEKGAHTLKFMVRREGLVLQVNGQDFYTVQGWEKVSLNPLLAVPDKSVIFLGCLNSGFQVSKFVITYPKN